MDLSSICQEIIVLVKEVGLFIEDEYNHFNFNKTQVKDDSSLVSYVDIESEKRIVNRLDKLLKNSTFVTEEASPKMGTTDYRWFIDPLDGTTNFIYGIPVFCISIALEYKEELVLAVIYNPIQKVCFSAIKGKGAFCNGLPMHISKRKKLSDGLITTGFPYTSFDYYEAYLKILGEINEKSRGVRRLGSAALDLAYVAQGIFDAFYEYGLKSWDVSAGILLVTESGGHITDFMGKSYNHVSGKNIVASNQYLHSELIGIINTYIPNL